jgi:hypothetical protein
MRLNIILGITFILVAFALATLSWLGIFKDTWLGKADKIASVVALLIAITMFFLPSRNNPDTARINPQIQIGDNAQGNIIGQSGTGDVNIGDTTTSAKQRADSALPLIKNELLDNFSHLSVLVQTISNRAPVPYWDTRRPGETEFAYQERAKNEFRSYQQEIEQYLRDTQRRYSKNVFVSQQVNIAYYPEQTEQIRGIYTELDETIDTFSELLSGLQHIASLNLSDFERSQEGQLLHQEKIIDAKMTLVYAAAKFCLIIEQDIEARMLNDALNLAGISVTLKPGSDGYQAGMQLASEFAQEKARILEQRFALPTTMNYQQIDKQINDPYLIMLRKAVGLPETLTEDEVQRLMSKELDLDEEDPAELFKYAVFSYLEFDGRAAVAYFRKTLESGELSELQAMFANISIDRLENPDRYDGSIGIMIARLTDNGNFQRSGLMVGDVIIAVNNEIVNEPYDIASALAQSPTEQVLLTVLRNEHKIIISVKRHEPAGALVTQLIVLNGVQL